MALLLQAIEVLDSDTTHCSVMIIDTLVDTDKVKIVRFSVAATTFCIGVQELDTIIKSRTLYKDRYFVVYQEIVCSDPPLAPNLKVRVVIDDSEDEDTPTTTSVSLPRSNVDEDDTPRKKTRHGEIRRGKSIKAVNNGLKITTVAETL